ncbi:MAG: alpha/beta hydrolase-fold protein [Steroidobacteraceae bacterium]
MRAIFEPARPGGCASSRRMLLLHAAYASPAEFLREGFAAAVRARGLDLDLVLPELELDTVLDRSVLPALRTELILPARAAGCREVWLGGISLGGYVALACAARHPEDIDGLCLLAPYLGSHIVTGEIERAGGVEAWQPGEPTEADDERRIWQFIRSRGTAGSPPIHLGMGKEDRFAARHRLLATALPPTHVASVPGGHDWPAWRKLWEHFLDTAMTRPNG